MEMRDTKTSELPTAPQLSLYPNRGPLQAFDSLRSPERVPSVPNAYDDLPEEERSAAASSVAHTHRLHKVNDILKIFEMERDKSKSCQEIPTGYQCAIRTILWK
jgi:hypothetical protein